MAARRRGVLLYPPRSGDLREPPVTSIRWELLAKGQADTEYFSALDELLERCGGAGQSVEATRSQAALTDVGKVVWNFSNVPSNVDLGSGGGEGKHYLYDHPYSTNTTLMHEVLDRVAMQIEAMGAACGAPGQGDRETSLPVGT